MAITATIGGAILLVPLSVVPPVPLGGVEIITGAHEGGGRQDETVEHLKHEIKRLSEQLERMGKGGSKRDKGLEEVVAGAERIMPELILDAAEVVENPPKTWDKYLKEGKTADIIRMEGKEFMTAIEKAESVEHFLKEATHTLAAVMLFCAEK